MNLGKCPFCDGGIIENEQKNVRGKKIMLYKCSNAEWEISPDGEQWDLKDSSTCDFKIWQNALGRYGKWFKNNEIRELLEEQQLLVKLISKKYGKKIEYEKYIILDKEYGVTVLWD